MPRIITAVVGQGTTWPTTSRPKRRLDKLPYRSWRTGDTLTDSSAVRLTQTSKTSPGGAATRANNARAPSHGRPQNATKLTSKMRLDRMRRSPAVKRPDLKELILLTHLHQHLMRCDYVIPEVWRAPGFFGARFTRPTIPGLTKGTLRTRATFVGTILRYPGIVYTLNGSRAIVHPENQTPWMILFRQETYVQR